VLVTHVLGDDGDETPRDEFPQPGSDQTELTIADRVNLARLSRRFERHLDQERDCGCAHCANLNAMRDASALPRRSGLASVRLVDEDLGPHDEACACDACRAMDRSVVNEEGI